MHKRLNDGGVISQHVWNVMDSVLVSVLWKDVLGSANNVRMHARVFGDKDFANIHVI